MEYKKTIILLSLVVFLLSIAGVSASEIDNTIASENANTIELSTDNDIEDNLQTSEENMVFTSTDYDEALSAQTDTKVLGADSAKYSDLDAEISQPGNITLTHKNYTYNEGKTITISEENKVIDGNGAVIDMNGSTIRAFHVTASSVTIKNLTIKNANYDGDGGAIYFDSTGTVTNCNFTNNTASGDGGAVYFWDPGTVTNCNFTGNTATRYGGGAIYFLDQGTVTNCNFTNNSATYDGGAVWIISGTVSKCNFINNKVTEEDGFGGAVYFPDKGTVTNCNFTGNSARKGGAVYFHDEGSVSNCNFTGNKATGDDGWGGAIRLYSGTVSNCNFTDNSATVNGGAIYFSNTGSVSNCNFTGNTASGDGGAIYFTQDATGNVINCNFTNNSAMGGGAVYFNSTGEVICCNFVNNRVEILEDCEGGGGALRFSKDGTIINCNFINNVAVESWGAAVYFDGHDATGTIITCNFTNNAATVDGGAISFNNHNITGNVRGCNFANNTGRWGGAIDAAGICNVSSCNFSYNKALDGSGGAIYFNLKGEVTDCNFIGNSVWGKNNDGGAIQIYSGKVTRCNFTDNSASSDGGAISFSLNTEVTNCNFANNKAISGEGGAIYIWDTYETGSTIENCSFINNQATSGHGGAIYFRKFCNVENCNFTDNTASRDGGAVYFDETGTVSNCNFTGNNATTGSAIYFYKWVSSDTLTVSDSTFLNNRANAGALDVVKNDNNITITFTGQNNLLNAIYSRNGAEVTFTNVTYWGADGITTISATMSGSNKAAGQNITVKGVVNGKIIDKINGTDENGEIVLDDTGDYWIIVSHKGDLYYTEIAETLFTNMKVYANVTSLTTNNKTVNITAKSNIPQDVVQGKLLFILPNGTQIDAIYGANGTWWAEHTFDDYGEYNVNATYVGLDNVTVNNGTITINKVNSTIALDNIVLDYGESANVTVTTTGATGITANINGTDVTVINNYTIPISGLGAGNYILTVTTIADDNHNPVTKEVTITVNKVSTEITLANETLDLKVNDEFAVLADLTPAGAGNLTYSSSNESVVKVSDEGLITALSEGTSIVTVSFAGNDNYTVAQNKTINVTVSLNDASVSAEDITLDIGANATIGAVSVPEGLKVTYIPDNSGVVTVENGVVTAVKEGTAKITLKVGGDGIYAENSTTITVTVNKINATVDVLIPENVTVGDNSTVNVVLPEDATGNVTVKVDGEVVDTVPVKDGSADVTIPSMSAGNHTVNVSYSGDDNYKSSSKTATLSVAKDSTNLTAANVTATYNINKYLVITLKDSKGNPLANSTVTVDLNGAKNYTTDENGQVKVKVSNLVPKTYSAKITFDGNGNYLGSDATAKVVVKKATPKITANAKTFKTTTKTKKYTITLKDNTGKAIKNAKVYLKVNGKTYKATTNSKGKATFKITKLDKKGTFKATITYKGSKYYNKVTKKANIKVISTWKTISKGSKLKSTVKEIQRALKNNGYYLTAYGHYLMVDGIYWDHTVNAVKQFQKAKGLKVTGKVDEKTAKKLGII